MEFEHGARAPVRHNTTQQLQSAEVEQYPDLRHIQEAEQNPEIAANREVMTEWVRSMIPDWIREHENEDVRNYAEFTARASATALLTELHHYGDGYDLGAAFRANPRENLPPTYHNVVGTLFAIFGAATYMEYDRSEARRKGEPSDYDTPETYLTTLLVASFDDIRFGDGRRTDEEKSAKIAAEYLAVQGVRADIVKEVRNGVLASTYNEITGGTDVDITNPVQRASVIGDVLHMATPWGAVQALRLLENLHKQGGPVRKEHAQILKHHLQDLVPEDIPDTVPELIALIERSRRLTEGVGAFIADNRAFLAGIHRFPVSEFEEAVRPGKEANADYQGDLGARMLLQPGEPDRLTYTQAYQKALEYAERYRYASVVPIPDYLQPVYTQLLGAASVSLRAA